MEVAHSTDGAPHRGGLTSRGRELVFIVFVVTCITAAASHLVVSWLGVRTSRVSHRVAGAEWPKPMAYVAGSSLLGDALNVQQACKELQLGMQTWFVAGGSPSEWIHFQNRAPDAQLTIIGVSAYDLNEHFFCDVQANIVPLPTAVRDLTRSGSGWAFAKRVLSQYPLRYLRILFPTAGRSQGVMGGVRERAERLLRPGAKIESDAGPKVPAWGEPDGSSTNTERISNWSQGHMLRRLAKLRSACHGQHSYDGPKRFALQRMLEQARHQGRVVVLVLPVSAAYHAEFLDARTLEQFERAQAELQRAVSGVDWVRLDRLPELRSNDLYWDIVHMNGFGKKIATEAILRSLRETGLAR